MGTGTNTKQRIILDTALSRRKLQRVLQGNNLVTVKSLSVLGESEALILRNIVKLVERKGTIKVLQPRLTLGVQSVKLLRAILESSSESIARRRLLGRVLSNILQNTQLSKPAVQSVELLKKVLALRAEKKSLRVIAKETGVSKNTVARILQTSLMKTLSILLPVIFVFTSACSSTPPQWTPREPTSVISSASDEPPEIQEGLTAADYRLLIKESIVVLRKCPKLNPGVPHLVSSFDNQTSAELDINLLRRELIDILQQSSFALVDKQSREDIHLESIFESESGYTNPETSIVRGRQSGIRVLIRTLINSRMETRENNRFTRYRMSLQLVNTDTSEISCTGSADIKKHYFKDRTGW